MHIKGGLRRFAAAALAGALVIALAAAAAGRAADGAAAARHAGGVRTVAAIDPAARAAMGYWGAFARAGRPTTAGALPWPAYQRGGAVMSLRPAYDSEVLPAATLHQTHHCALWDTIPG